MKAKCPHCGTEYEVEKQSMYRYTKCGVCGNGFVVGVDSSLLSSEPSAPNPPSPASPKPSGTPQEPKSSTPPRQQETPAKRLKCNCPHCGAKYEFDKDDLGRAVPCEVCGKEFTLKDSSVTENHPKARRVKPGAVNFDFQKAVKKAFANEGRGLGAGFWTFNGRATRSEYWSVALTFIAWSVFVALPLMIVPIVRMLNPVFHGMDPEVSGVGISCVCLGLLLLIFCRLAMLPVTVRRLHDHDMSAWWILWFKLFGWLPFVGIVKFVLVACMDCIPGPNRYGPDPKGRAPLQWTNRPWQPSVVGVSGNTNDNTASSPSVEERLQKLTKLKERGFISEAEYAEKRLQILSEL